MREVDVIVIGGGSVGENAAQYAVKDRKASAVIIEADLLGGECSFYACMPSKALLRPLDVQGAAAHLQGLSRPELDRGALLARRDRWVSHYDDASQVDWATDEGLEVIRGSGRITAERTVAVCAPDGSTQELRAREAVIIATGSTAAVPEEFADVHPWTSRDVTGVVDVPESLAIVGGGVVAVEAARWMVALGSQVTMLIRGDRLLERAEPFAGEIVCEALTALGVDVRFDTSVTAVARHDVQESGIGRIHGGPVSLTLDGEAGTQVREFSEVLVATGRRPAIDDIGLDAVGISPDDLIGRLGGGPLPPWLYVVGDANGTAPVTHWGKHEARVVGAHIASVARSEATGPPVARGPVPQVVFSDPLVAWVGVTEKMARDEGIDVQVRDAQITAAVGARLLRDDATGQARLVVRRDDDVIIGATFVGPEIAELLHSATVAITGELTCTTLRNAVPSFPTVSEVWLRLLEG